MASPGVFLGPTPEFPALMTRQLTAMRDNGTLTDFTITAEDKKFKFPCHKVVLAIYSPYFTTMFTTDMVEAEKQTVHYEHISQETMKLILDYCYYEQIGFPSDQLISLIIASDYVDIERLKKRCVNEVKAILNPDSVLKYLTFACEQNLKDLENIKIWSLEIIVKSFFDVAKKPAFLALKYDVRQECVKAVIPSDVKRDDVLYAVFQWVKNNAESRGEYLSELLQQMQLDICSLPAVLDVMITYETMISKVKMLGLLAKAITAHTAKIQKTTEPAKAKTFLNPKNVLQYLAFAVKHSLQDIKSWCFEIIVKRFSAVSMEPAFLALSYAELQDCMSEVAQSDVEGDEVLRALFKWVNDNAELRGKHLEELLKHIQLENCSLSGIIDVMDANETIVTSNVKVFSLLTKSVKKLTDQIQPTKKTLVIAGGEVGEVVSPTCWSLDTTTKKISKLFHIPFPELAKQHSVCEIIGGFALTGGEDSDMCVVFVASTMSWQIMPKMLLKRYAHGSIYMKGILYVLCGSISGSMSSSVHCITVQSGQWERLPDSPIATLYPKLAELHDKLYMLGNVTNKVLEFDVEKRKWNERASLPCVVSEGASMVAVNGQLCVVGVRVGDRGICAWYNQVNDTWSISTNKTNKKHLYGSLLQVDATTLLLLGGSYGNGSDSIEELNIMHGSWSVMDVKMPANLCCHKALFLDIPQQH